MKGLKGGRRLDCVNIARCVYALSETETTVCCSIPYRKRLSKNEQPGLKDAVGNREHMSPSSLPHERRAGVCVQAWVLREVTI